jgi:hypothetical protein
MTAERSSTKATSVTRASRGKLIAAVAPQSPLWQNDPAIEKSGKDVIDAGAKVAADDVKIAELENQLSAARLGKIVDEVSFDSKFDVYASHVEDVCTTPAEMHELALDPLGETTYHTAAPLGLTAMSNQARHDITAQVKRAAGLKRCAIEVSADLTMATGIRQFPGDGARQTMGPFPPGTYALRACHVRSDERSAYTDIVTVIVK